jgi:hypothetical protein
MNESLNHSRSLTTLEAVFDEPLQDVAPDVSPQLPQGSIEERARQELLKIKPDLGGFRNGVFIEPDPIDYQDHSGYTSLFDGQTLNGWDGHPDVWSVQDGMIVGETTVAKFPHTFPNTFLVYKQTQARDFDLKVEIKVEKGGGSGIQYRSTIGEPPGQTPQERDSLRDPRWTMMGPQADFWYPVDATAKRYTGQLYSQNDYRGIIAWRGQAVQCLAGKTPQLVGHIADRDKLGECIKNGEWNQYMILARGAVIVHILNGQLMAVLVDNDPSSTNNISGFFGLQVEGVPCIVSFRNLWLRKLG